MEVFSVASSMQYCQSTEYIVLLLTVVSIDVTSVAVFFALFLPHEDCNSFAPYCIVCCGLSVCLSVLFSTLLHKLDDFRENFLNIKCVS